MAKPASTFITRSKGRCWTGRRGFTLVELMLASVLSAIVFAALFSAYIFMARNLTRMANFQQQQVQDRRALYVLTKDISEATQVTAALPAQLSLTLATQPSTTAITYLYDATLHQLTRQVNGAVPAPVLLSNLTSFSFSYFDKNGAPSPPVPFLMQVQMSYTSAVGDRPNGTQSADTVVSARMVLRSKPPLGQ